MSITDVYRRVVPSDIRRLVYLVRRRLTRPSLRTLATNLTDHCNLNCRGCGYYAPLASPWFADLAQHEKDMRQLARYFANINTIRLAGGEPCLHLQVTSFLACTRRWFPNSNIRLVTNGTLLKKMKPDFWQCCREHRIGIDVTIYPPTAKKAEGIANSCKDNGVEVLVKVTTHFFAHKNLKGDSDPVKAMAICRERIYCPFLREGKLYICGLPALSHYFNAEFGTNIPHTGYVDIHSRNLTGRKILRFLEQPADVCRFCSYDFRTYEWSFSKKSIQEWNASSNE